MGRPAPTWLFAQIFGQGDGKEWSTDYWYSAPGGTAPANFDPVQLATDFYGVLNTAIAGLMYSNFFLVGAKVEVNFSTGTFGGKLYSTTVGTGTTGPMPEDVAAVVRKNTTHGGRSYTGVNRYSMLDQSLVSGSYLNATGIAAIGAVKSATLLTFTSQTILYTPCVYSRKLNILTVISGIEALALLGTCRRRRPRF